MPGIIIASFDELESLFSYTAFGLYLNARLNPASPLL